MPSSSPKNDSITSWPRTPDGPTIPDVFTITGDCVMEESFSKIRHGIPTARKPEHDQTIPKFLGGLVPGALFRGHQNAAEDSKRYNVEVEIKV